MATNDVPAAQQAEAGDAVCGYLFPNTFKCILPSGHAGEHDWRISRLDPWDQKHTVKEKPDQRLWTQQEVDAELTALKSSQQQLRPLLPLGHEPIVCYLRASNGEQRWIGCSCGANVETFNMTDRFWYRNHIADLNESLFSKLKSSQQEERAELTRLRALLNTPEIEEFDKAVPLEASHQQLRWGSEHDSGKNPEDWFWLVGYLAGKSLAAFKSGDMDKAKHHTISTAAALRNWHAHIRSGQNVMRPGIKEPAEAAHLAEQAKAQEAHQNELEDVRDFKDVVIENNRKIYEQTSLASQAKLVRKCAATHCNGCKSGNVPSYGSRGLLWHLDANGIEDAICASRGTLELITPAMLQAEEAALAAEESQK